MRMEVSKKFIIGWVTCQILIGLVGETPAEDLVLLRHLPSNDPRRAVLRIDVATRSPHRVNPFLYGKFTEHLGQNIYNGIDAQILMNPTFGKWAFSAGDSLIDGGATVESDLGKIAAQIERYSRWLGLPNPSLLLESYKEGAAFGWMRTGSKKEVVLSPDVGDSGNRAQRIEVVHASEQRPQGIMQYVFLPLHRTRNFFYQIVAKATKPGYVLLSIHSLGPGGKVGEELAFEGVSLEREYTITQGWLEISPEKAVTPDSLYLFAITSTSPANFVIDRVLLYPDDHVNFADPDVIRFYQESHLPIMRWPGGNFVSGYHWTNGVGVLYNRRTLVNPAWGGLEYNLFGTDEFVALCRAIGCQAMICVNAGDGAPGEAAAWVEYCNGSKDTRMGRLRAENGHPEPYGIKYWEVGNELYGQWQIGWTTPQGYADRYDQFYTAMKSADPSIQVLACGDRTYKENEWNNQLISRDAAKLGIITDHILTGGLVDSTTNPNELYQASLGYAAQLGHEYRDLRQHMSTGGVKQPRLAITELQLFAHFRRDAKQPWAGGGLSAETMPDNKTITEALYDATIIHECIRMGDFVEMLTHSATVNHGAGLQKRKERVWADPSYYGHLMGQVLSGCIPVAVSLECGTYSTRRAFADIRPMQNIPVLDAMAVLSLDESKLHLMLVHRASTTGPISITIDPGSFEAASEADVLSLAAETMYARNTLNDPDKIKARGSTITLRGGKTQITLPPYSLTRVTFKK
jgi:alpha-N-arabinofuranosidase